MTVIFMDDDAEYRDLAQIWLNTRGVEAIMCKDGHEAVHALVKHPEVEAAILDVMGEKLADEGVWTARALTAIKPELRVVLISSGPRPVQDFLFAQKPYDIDRVLRIIAIGEGSVHDMKINEDR